jgi:hypothetical protein
MRPYYLKLQGQKLPDGVLEIDIVPKEDHDCMKNETYRYSCLSVQSWCQSANQPQRKGEERRRPWSSSALGMMVDHGGVDDVDPSQMIHAMEQPRTPSSPTYLSSIILYMSPHTYPW